VPVGGLQLTRDAAGEAAGLQGGGVALLADHELGPGERRCDVDRGQLPDRALGALQPPDVEAVDADQLAGPVDVDVLFGAGIARRLVGSGVAGDQPQALGPGVQAVAAQDLPDTIGRDHDATPLLARQLGGHPPRAQAGMRQREADDALLDHLGQLVGHLRTTTLTRAQHLQPVAVDLALPRVVGRAMHPEGPARRGHRRARGLGEQLQAIAEQHVILRHQLSSLTWR
jgi:hypothetical protein